MGLEVRGALRLLAERVGPHGDVAVKVGRDLNLLERARLYSGLQRPFERRPDLAFLDDWDPVLAREALSKGKLLYCVNEGEFYEDSAKALDEVADLEPFLKLFERETERALSRVASERRPRSTPRTRTCKRSLRGTCTCSWKLYWT